VCDCQFVVSPCLPAPACSSLPRLGSPCPDSLCPAAARTPSDGSLKLPSSSDVPSIVCIRTAAGSAGHAFRLEEVRNMLPLSMQGTCLGSGASPLCPCAASSSEGHTEQADRPVRGLRVRGVRESRVSAARGLHIPGGVHAANRAALPAELGRGRRGRCRGAGGGYGGSARCALLPFSEIILTGWQIHEQRCWYTKMVSHVLSLISFH